jgi:hypothetical protein
MLGPACVLMLIKRPTVELEDGSATFRCTGVGRPLCSRSGIAGESRPGPGEGFVGGAGVTDHLGVAQPISFDDLEPL